MTAIEVCPYEVTSAVHANNNSCNAITLELQRC